VDDSITAFSPLNKTTNSLAGIIKKIPLVCLLAVPLIVANGQLSGTKSVIYRAVDTFRPGDAEPLFGDWPANASVEVSRLSDQTAGTILSWERLKP
jgi:hypothetical protein